MVYVRVSGQLAQSPVGDECLGCLQDVLWLGSDHLRWRLIAQVGIHPTEPRTDSLGLVVLDEQADDLIGVAQTTLRVRMRRTKAAGPLADRFGVVHAGHDGSQTLTKDFLKARGGFRHGSPYRTSVSSLPNYGHRRHQLVVEMLPETPP